MGRMMKRLKNGACSFVELYFNHIPYRLISSHYLGMNESAYRQTYRVLNISILEKRTKKTYQIVVPGKLCAMRYQETHYQLHRNTNFLPEYAAHLIGESMMSEF